MANDINLKINIDGEEAIYSVNQLEETFSKMGDELNSIEFDDSGFEELKKIIENIKKELNNLKLNVNTDQAAIATKNLEDSFKDLSKIAQTDTVYKIDTTTAEKSVDLLELNFEKIKENANIPVIVNDEEIIKSASSIKDLRKEMKALQDKAVNLDLNSKEYGETILQAAELKNKIEDIEGAVNSVKGDQIASLSGQFTQLGMSLSSLDFEDVTRRLIGIKATIGSIDAKKVGEDIVGMGKAIGGTLLTSIKSIGNVILKNPLLLLPPIIIGIGIAIYNLKDKFEFIQNWIDALNKPIKFLTEEFNNFTDSIGITNNAEKERLENVNKAYEERLEKIKEGTAIQLNDAKARGASEREFQLIQKDSNEQIKQELDLLARRQGYADSDDMLKSIQDHKKGLEDENAAILSTLPELEKRRNELNKINDLTIAQKNELSTLSSMIDENKATLEKNNKDLTKNKDEWDKNTQAIIENNNARAMSVKDDNEAKWMIRINQAKKEIELRKQQMKDDLEMAQAQGKSREQLYAIEQNGLEKIKNSNINLIKEMGKIGAEASKIGNTSFSEKLGAEMNTISSVIIEIQNNIKLNSIKYNTENKKIAEEYYNQISGLAKKYNDDKRATIEESFQNDLNLIKGNSTQELALRKQIKENMEKALSNFDIENERKRVESENKINELKIQNDLNSEREILDAKLKNKEISEREYIQENARIELNSANQIYALRFNMNQKMEEQEINAAKARGEGVGEIEQKYTEIYKTLLDQRNGMIKESNENLFKNDETTFNAAKIKIETDLNGFINEINKRRDSLDQMANKPSLLSFLFPSIEKGELDSNFNAIKEQIENAKNLELKAAEDSISNAEQLAKKKEEIQANYNAKMAEQQAKYNEQQNALNEQFLGKMVESAQLALSLLMESSSIKDDNEKTKLNEELNQLNASYAAKKELIEKNITDEKEKAAALQALDNEFNTNKKKIDNDQLALEKKRIKRERNAAIASILLSNAVAIASAVQGGAKAAAASGPLAPFVLAATIATMVTTIALTIAKAKAALKDADAAAGSITSSTGTDISSSMPTVNTQPPAMQNNTTNINNTTNVNTQTQQQVPQIWVNVSEINQAQANVNVAQNNARWVMEG